MPVPQPIQWTDEGVVMLDQRRLPAEVVYHTFTDYRDVARAIQSMVIRGAPAIGVAAAMGVALGVERCPARTLDELKAEFALICDTIARTRPTAVDLFWAIERMKRRFSETTATPAADIARIRSTMVAEARQIHLEKKAIDEAIGRFGVELMPDEGQVMTQCNAGALATAGIGTALGVIRMAVEQGRRLRVLVPETRPYLQGARLTAWELAQDGIPLTLITDNMAGHFMKRGDIDCVVVGADRIAANGDVANKIGTYPLAVLARRHDVPFVVAAPVSTVDLATPDGTHIPVETRSPDEVRMIAGRRITPDGVAAANRAFDVTPASLVSAIVTERGVARRPYVRSLARLCAPREAVTPRP